MVTLGQMKTKTWQEMEVNSDSTTYNTDRLRDMINEVSLEFLEGKVANELTGKYVQGNVLNFNKSKFAIKILGPKALTADVELLDNEILFDTTDIPETGAILLGDEIISYTGKTADRITGCQGILSEHKIGNTIQFLYTLPEDFWKPLKMYKVFNNRETEILYRQSENDTNRFYEVRDTFIFTYGLQAGDIYYIEYTKLYDPLVDDTDETVLTDYIALNIIPFIAGGRMIKDELLRVKLLSQGYNKVMTEYTKQGESLGKPKGVQWKRYDFSSIR